MHFCDDEESSLHKHNREAPNQHNAVCDTQSVWSVITRHIDFVENNNLPATIADLKPTFNVVRVLNGARYVLVTDVSGSMVDYVSTLDNEYLLYDFYYFTMRFFLLESYWKVVRFGSTLDSV
jgi:hypothetical protein